MKYTTLGESGLIVSRLSFGAMTFGKGILIGDLKNKVDQKDADRMVGLCLDAGINFFDTADMYTSGQSEIMLGKALKNKRHDVIIATKCGFRSGDAITSAGLSYHYILKAVENSLKRLDTDYIDLFFLHIPDPVTPLEETVEALDAVVRKGWVRYVGFSNYPAWKAQKMLNIQSGKNLARFICAQMYYSLLGRDLEHDVVPFLVDNGLGLMVWSPLASGFLTGKYTREDPKPSGSRRAKFDFPPIDVEKGYALVERLRSIGEKYGASISQTALAWVLAKPFVSTVLIGASNIEQLKDNLAAETVVLSAEDIQALDDMTEPYLPYPAIMQPMGWDAMIKEGLEG